MHALRAPNSAKLDQRAALGRRTPPLVGTAAVIAGLVVLVFSARIDAAEGDGPPNAGSAGERQLDALNASVGAEHGSASGETGGGSMTVFESRPVAALTVDIGHKKGEEPEDLSQEQLSRIQVETGDSVFARDWSKMCYRWAAPALAYRPLYFEEVNLERYGYGVKHLRIAQPLISAGQFFATVPTLPYRMFAEPACEPVYPLGHYRPGSCVPYQVIVPPLDVRAGAVEGGALAGLILLIP